MKVICLYIVLLSLFTTCTFSKEKSFVIIDEDLLNEVNFFLAEAKKLNVYQGDCIGISVSKVENNKFRISINSMKDDGYCENRFGQIILGRSTELTLYSNFIEKNPLISFLNKEICTNPPLEKILFLEFYPYYYKEFLYENKKLTLIRSQIIEGD